MSLPLIEGRTPVQHIEDLIQLLAKNLTEEEYLEALDELCDRALTARDVKAEELGVGDAEDV